MDEFSIGKYPQSSVLVVYSDKSEIFLDPDYQRIGGIWNLEKRQLLLDSLINGFDVPKLYFHEFVPSTTINGNRCRYAIIDGKQRLQTIWSFIDGNLVLADDFKYLKDENVDAQGLGYAELGTEYPKVKARFDATLLDIVTIRTTEIEIIEEMFSRLNEAVPLNAPEKRNALGGPMPKTIANLAKHIFFTNDLPFADKRYRHRELATKFLYLEHKNEIANTKKKDLDTFVKRFKIWRGRNLKKASIRTVRDLGETTENTLSKMDKVFSKNDPLLRQVGMVTLYYHLFRFIQREEVDSITRNMLLSFEETRRSNRAMAEADDDDVNNKLLEFDKHSQTPNDAYAIRIRMEILLEYLNEEFEVEYNEKIILPEKKRTNM